MSLTAVRTHMALTPRLEIKTGQSLVMTPQLQQAIKLLQLSNLELREFIEKELEQNPLLDRDDQDSFGDNLMAEEHGASNTPAKDNVEIAGFEDSTDGLESLDLQHQEDFSENQVNALDMEEFDNIWEREGSPTPGLNNSIFSPESGNGKKINFDQDSYSIEHTVSQEISLRDHLISQIQLELQDPKERMIAFYLTNHLDEYGRLSEDLDELASRIGCVLSKIEQVVHRVQEFDPPGIFARTLKECWEIQLRERNRLDPAMVTLLENIELLKMHDYSSLSKLCNVHLDDIQDMINEIWALAHNPADAFNKVVSQPVTADVIMSPGSQGKWLVELNTAELPKVLVNNSYYVEICGNIRTKEERKYIIDKLQWANWLVKSLHQRATTILKVASEIVSQQETFFDLGVEHLKPLALKDIADEIQMHESTVSRVTSNKYIDTPRGIFELKYFFNTAIASSNGGDSLSSEAVRYKIKKLIDQEKNDAILSDDKLVKILRSNGIEVARRTVAKYRETLKIPSSVNRRRQKKRLIRIK